MPLIVGSGPVNRRTRRDEATTKLPPGRGGYAAPQLEASLAARPKKPTQ
ncbi:MAG: hypothetical protein U0836_18960 [Pirellulales bacterium]